MADEILIPLPPFRVATKFPLINFNAGYIPLPPFRAETTFARIYPVVRQLGAPRQMVFQDGIFKGGNYFTIDTRDVTDSAITTAKLNDGAVTAAKLASDSVTTAKILDANVTPAKLSVTVAQVVSVPAGNGSTGTAGQMAFDATHIYWCYGTNQWSRTSSGALDSVWST